MLQLRGVAKTYAVKGDTVPALRDIDLDVAAGRLTGVLGPSGSGKSTLLRVVAGFERPDTGTVTLAGRALVAAGTFVRPERRGIGVVPQDGALFPHLDVAGNIAFGLAGAVLPRRGRTGRRARERRVAELLDMVGLPGYERRKVDELSGGEQQRVALARALAPRPQVVLLDEPFSAIDAALRAELGTQVRTLLRELGITTVLVTHDQSEALSLADHVVVMRAGRIAQAGTPREVYEQPADEATARFVGDAMVLPAEVVAADPAAGLADRCAQVRCRLGLVTAGAVAAGPPPVPGTNCRIVLRPENLVITAGDGAGTAARVVSAEYYGHDAMLTLALDTNGPNGADRSGPGAGGTVRVRTHDLDPAALLGRSVRVQVRGPVLVLK